MNSKRLTLFSGCVAGAALLWGWYLLSRQPDPVLARMTSLPADHSDRSDKKAAAAWPARGTPELRERLREPAARWLDFRGRDAAGLIAIWDLCRDGDLLTEAASRFPNDPRVCRAMLAANSDDMNEDLVWIEKLIALEPKNPEGHYLKALELFNADRDAEALDALRAATAIGLPRKARLRDRAITLRDAATALGLPARDAALAPIEFLRDQELGRWFYHPAGIALAALMDKASDAGDTDTLTSLGRTALAAHLNQGGITGLPLSFSDEFDGTRYLRTILDRLPDDWAWNPGGYTAAEWKEHADKEWGEIVRAQGRWIEANERRLSAPTDLVVEYSRRYLADGEAKANDWILAQPGPAPK